MTEQKSDPCGAFTVGEACVACGCLRAWLHHTRFHLAGITTPDRWGCRQGCGAGAPPALLVGCLGGPPCARTVWPHP